MQMNINCVAVSCLEFLFSFSFFFPAFIPIFGFLKLYFCDTGKIFLSICVILSSEKHIQLPPSSELCSQFQGIHMHLWIWGSQVKNLWLKMSNLLGDASCYLFLCNHGTYMISQNTIDFFKNFYIFPPSFCSLQIKTLLIIFLLR